MCPLVNAHKQQQFKYESASALGETAHNHGIPDRNYDQLSILTRNYEQLQVPTPTSTVSKKLEASFLMSNDIQLPLHILFSNIYLILSDVFSYLNMCCLCCVFVFRHNQYFASRCGI